MSNKVRVAVIGVGNCASALIQGIHFYRNASRDERIPGIMNVDLGGLHIGDIEISAAIDVDSSKVGKDVSEAIWQGRNNTIKFADVPLSGVRVARGPTLDGLGTRLTDMIVESDEEPEDIATLLEESATDVVINYLPVGSEAATRYYAEAALSAKCAFVNCIPVFLASSAEWQRKFAEAGVPIMGDDIKSQVGATIVHRNLVSLFNDRGVELQRTSQLNVGGNTDFYNMLDRSRLHSKKISKTNAVASQLPYELPAEDIYIGPSDYVPWLEDRKWAHIRLEGLTFGNVPLNLELKLEVWDSPNSAGIVIDAVRCAKLALDRGLSGALVAPSSYFKKSPPRQYPDHIAKELVERFIAGETEAQLTLVGNDSPQPATN